MPDEIDVANKLMEKAYRQRNLLIGDIFCVPPKKRPIYTGSIVFHPLTDKYLGREGKFGTFAVYGEEVTGILSKEGIKTASCGLVLFEHE